MKTHRGREAPARQKSGKAKRIRTMSVSVTFELYLRGHLDARLVAEHVFQIRLS